MSYVPIIQSRRSFKANEGSTRKAWIKHIMIVVMVSFLLLFPILPQRIFANNGTIFAMFTLLLFASFLTWLTIRLVRILLAQMRSVNYGMKEAQASRVEKVREELADADMSVDTPRLKKNNYRGLEAILSVAAWATFLKLLQPFITAVLWWQGYQLIAGNDFSVVLIERAFALIEFFVYFGIFVLLVLISWSEWNYWRYGREISEEHLV
jgi:hypothetical protein